METKMVVRCHEVEVNHFFLNLATPDLAAYADKFGVPPQKIFVTVKGTATQLSAYGRIDLTTGEVVDNTNHQTLYTLWHLFAKGDAVSPEVEMPLEEFEKLVAYSRDFSEARLIDAEIDYLETEIRHCKLFSRLPCTVDIDRAEKIRDSAPTLSVRISDLSAKILDAREREKEREDCEEAERRQRLVNQKERIEKFLRKHDAANSLADQYRAGLLAEDDLRKFARNILFDSMKEITRYKQLDKDDCPRCADDCFERSVEYSAEDATLLPVDLYPAYVDLTARVSVLLPSKCTPRHHHVTCGNCDNGIYSRYAVLVSLVWEGMTLSREFALWT